MDNNFKGYLEFKCMIQASFVLISHLMSHTSIDVGHIDCLIKIFLGMCNMFDTTFGLSDESNPFWCRKSNFVSLLNLPAQILKYGPVYLYWGGVKERDIQHVKPILKNKAENSIIPNNQTTTIVTTECSGIEQRAIADIQHYSTFMLQ